MLEAQNEQEKQWAADWLKWSHTQEQERKHIIVWIVSEWLNITRPCSWHTTDKYYQQWKANAQIAKEYLERHGYKISGEERNYEILSYPP